MLRGVGLVLGGRLATSTATAASTATVATTATTTASAGGWMAGTATALATVRSAALYTTTATAALVAPVARRGFVASLSSRGVAVAPTSSAVVCLSFNTSPRARYSTGSDGVYPIEFNYGGSGVARATIPLSSYTVALTLPHDETIQEWFNEIMAEDDSITDIYLTTEDGVRVGRTTTMRELLYEGPVGKGSKLNLHINGEVIVLEPTVSDEGDNCGEYANLTASTLLKRESFASVRDAIAQETRSQIPVIEFEGLCAGAGLSSADTQRLLRCLHGCGIVFHFENNPKLKDTVFLRPNDVTSGIHGLLSVKSPAELEAEREAIHDRLNVLKRTLAPLEETKRLLDARALSHGNNLMWMGLGYVTLQIAVIARLTWWEYSWDIMEPVSYIVGVTQAALGYLFFTVTKVDCSYDGMRDYFAERKRVKLYAKNGFRVDHYESLKKSVAALEKEIENSTKASARRAERLANKLQALEKKKAEEAAEADVEVAAA